VFGELDNLPSRRSGNRDRNGTIGVPENAGACAIASNLAV
jgi:hypothetical protein